MKAGKRSIKSNWLAMSILVAHLALGVLYSLAIPIWEAYDEWGHYEFVRYVAREHRLPPPGVKLIKWNDETHQPPLYYILSGLATSWIDTSDDLKPMWSQYAVGKLDDTRALHSDAESFPYEGTVLAIHVARFVSVLLSTAAVLATYFLGHTLFPRRKEIALGAMAINAFWPQFLFNGSVVTNDIMITACSSVFLFFLVRILVRRPSILDIFGLGVCLGGGLLSKRNGLALLPLAIVGLAIAAVREVRGKRIWMVLLGLAVFLLGAGLVSAWWLGGLWERYHEHTQFIISLLSHPSNLKSLHWDVLPRAFHYAFETLWACFGWGTIGVEGWVYKLVAVVCLAAGLGLVLFLVRSSDRLAKLGIAILVFALLVVLSAPTYQVLRSGRGIALHGRFVLPAISGFSLLLSLGLASLVPRRLENGLVLSLGVAVFAYALLIPFRYILPVYAKPKLLSPADVQDLEHPLGLRFDDRIELVGYELDREEVVPGEEIRLALYWRCLGEMEQNYTLAVKVLGRDYQVYGDLHLHPGRGSFPTSTWKKGNTFRETYQIPISSNVPTPSLAKMGVYFFMRGSLEGSLQALDPEGRPTSAIFGKLAVRAKQQPAYQIESPVYYNLGDKVALIGYEVDKALGSKGSGLHLTLHWQALAEMDRDYTVFVHLIDQEAEIRGQRDGQPLDGWYPTSLWQAEETVEDERFLPFSLCEEEGEYQIVVGMYDLATMERLTAFNDRGSRLPNDQIKLEAMKLPLSACFRD